MDYNKKKGPRPHRGESSKPISLEFFYLLGIAKEHLKFIMEGVKVTHTHEVASSSDSQSESDVEKDLIIDTDSENDLTEDPINKNKKKKRDRQ